MTDIAIPEAHLSPLEAIEVVPSISIEGLEPLDIARIVDQSGLDIASTSFAWRAAGARALLLTAMNSRYLIEPGLETPSLVTRVNEMPEKSRKIGPFIMLPIERCEVQPDEIIVLGRTFVLGGMCRATRKLQNNRGFHTGPVTAARYLP